jgi:hypothetical protein
MEQHPTNRGVGLPVALDGTAAFLAVLDVVGLGS